jgi:hypothetical protein
MPRITSVDNPGKLGRARMTEIARENEVDIAKIKADLISGLVRATAADQVLAEQIAVATVKARRLRSFGKNDGPERRLLARLVSQWPAQTPAQLQGFTPEQAARAFEMAAPGYEADRTPLVLKWPPERHREPNANSTENSD